MPDQAALRSDLKRLIVENLQLVGMSPDSLTDDAPLFGEGLGLDSVDALELLVALERTYGISIKSHAVDKTIFTSVAHLAAFVARATNGDGAKADDAKMDG